MYLILLKVVFLRLHGPPFPLRSCIHDKMTQQMDIALNILIELQTILCKIQ